MRVGPWSRGSTGHAIVRRVRAGSALVVLALLGLPYVAALHTEPTNWNCPTPKPNDPSFQCDSIVWDEQTFLFIESNGDAKSPFLVFDDEAAGSQDSHSLTAVQTGLTTGIADFGTGELGQSWNISLATALPKDYYLNVSRSFFGNIYYTHGVNQNQNVGKKTDWTHLRAELFSNGIRVAGYEDVITPATTTGAWIRFSLNLWPEVPVLRKDASLYLKISRSGGLADFIIGTGGDHQSGFDLRYTSVDPVGGILYLKGGKIVPYDPSAESESSPGPTAFGLVGLLGMGIRRRGAAFLVAVGILAAGCLGGAPAGPQATEEDSPYEERQAPIETQFVPVENGDPAAAGEIRGIVADDVGLPIHSAYVSIIGTSHFGTTGDQGEFGFQNVTARSHRLRVDHEGFASFEGDVEVRRGHVSILNITLFPAVEKAANDKPHRHGPFAGSATSYVVWTGSFAYTGCRAPTTAGNVCQTSFGVPTDQIVIPSGTGLVRVTLTWPTTPGGAQQLGLWVAPNRMPSQSTFKSGGGSSGASGVFYVARSSGDPFNVPILPIQADPGHQKFTGWQFSIRSMPWDPLVPPRWIDTAPITFDIKIVAFKGVVPFEPPHGDLWAGRSEIQLLNHVGSRPGPETAVLSFQNARPRWMLGKDAWVPPGTLEIRGYMKVERGPADFGDYTVVYKPAVCSDACSRWKPVPEQGSEDNRTFVVRPDVNETDQFYQARTYWFFSLERTNAVGDGYAYASRWFMSATAYRDPSWADDKFAYD